MHVHRRAASGAVAVLACALAAAGCTAAGEEPAAEGAIASATTPAPSPTPTEPPDPCVLTLGGRAVPLSADEAVRATDLAATAVRAGQGPAVLAPRLQVVPALAPVAPDAASALLGRAGPALTCAYPRGSEDPAPAGRRGLTPRANALLDAAQEAFGRLPTGGYAAGGVDSGHVEDSSHYDGRAIDVFFRPRTEREQQRRGWALAQWLVAHAQERSVLSVIYRDRIWTVWASSAGWRDYEHPSGNTRDPVLRHLDHVHTAVVGVRRR